MKHPEHDTGRQQECIVREVCHYGDIGTLLHDSSSGALGQSEAYSTVLPRTEDRKG
jgi:hypothetical protein